MRERAGNVNDCLLTTAFAFRRLRKGLNVSSYMLHVVHLQMASFSCWNSKRVLRMSRMQRNSIKRALIVGILTGAGIWAVGFWGTLFIQLSFWGAPFPLWQPFILLGVALLGLFVAIMGAFAMNAYRTGRLAALMSRLARNRNFAAQQPRPIRHDESTAMTHQPTTGDILQRVSGSYALAVGISTLATVIILAVLTLLTQRDPYPIIQVTAALLLATVVLGICVSYSLLQ